MSEIKQPDITPIADGEYILDEDYLYATSDYAFMIKKGFRYDGASVPRWAWTISGITPDGLIRAAALVHDYIYVHKGLVPLAHGYKRFTRAEADKVFYNIMVASGVKKHKAKIAYCAVRAAGWKYWNAR